MSEPIVECPACRGERIRRGTFGPRVCRACHGEGRVARARVVRTPEAFALDDQPPAPVDRLLAELAGAELL